MCVGDDQVNQRCRVLDTDIFHSVIGGDFLLRNLQAGLLCLQRPYALHCHFGAGILSVPLELSG